MTEQERVDYVNEAMDIGFHSLEISGVDIGWSDSEERESVEFT